MATPESDRPWCQRLERETLTEPALRGGFLPLSVTLLVPQPPNLDLPLSWLLMPVSLLGCLTQHPGRAIRSDPLLAGIILVP